MPLSIGARLGPYEVLSAIGAGGMGEVYRARDTRLDRSVAIKVLPSDFSTDPDRRARFEREAKTIAGLNHPHICTLHDVGEHDGSTFLVMEHLQGQTLADRLEKGPLPLEQALIVATEIADALAAAHRQGIIHRDLKPGNVILTKTGAKLLDFGLAKLTGHGEQAAAASLVSMPTQTRPLTSEGAIVGTLQYMAPEQMEGKPADARTDLWALGVILYEMLAGRRAFAGNSAASLIAAILMSEPVSLSDLQPLAPAALDRLVRTALAKDPEERWQSATDVKRELQWVADERRASANQGSASAHGAAAAAGSATTPWRHRLLFTAGLLVALFAGALATFLAMTWLTRRPAGDSVPVVTRAWIRVDPAERVESVPNMVTGGSRTAIAVAPDGRRIAFIGRTGDISHLYVRALAGDVAAAVPGTDGAECPAFSPDGNWIAFWSDGRLMKVQASGDGPVTQVCRVDSTYPPFGISWGDDGWLVYAHPRGGLMRVSADGGTPVVLTTLERDEVSHRLPQVLPGSKWVLYTLRKTAWLSGSEQIIAQSLSTRERKAIVAGGAVDARFVPTGHVVFLRSGTLTARAFDSVSVTASGPEYGLAQGIAQALQGTSDLYLSGAGQYAVSNTGTLIYLRGEIPGPGKSELIVIDRRGQATVLPTEAASFSLGLSIRPDGETVAITTRDLDRFGLWLVNLKRGSRSRVVSEGEVSWPLWTPDGRGLAFTWRAGGTASVAVISADSSAPPERLLTVGAAGAPAPLTWSPDGKTLLFRVQQPDGTNEIDTISRDDARRAPQPLMHLPGSQVNATLSADGKWLLYASNETGRYEVFLQAYPGTVARIPISTSGGMNPAWNPKGGELFYVSLPDQNRRRWLMCASFAAQPKVSVGVARPLFEFPREPGTVGRAYDVFPDGDRFLIARPLPVPRPAPATEIALVAHWFEELKAKVPVKR